jgi:hypothetical protein
MGVMPVEIGPGDVGGGIDILVGEGRIRAG